MEPSEDISAAELASRAARAAAEAVRAAERLQARARIAQTVSNIATAVAQRLELREMVASVLDQTVSTLGASMAYVLLADSERRELRIVDARNLPPDIVGRLGRLDFDSTLVSARAASSRLVQIVPSRDELGASFTFAHEIIDRTQIQSLVSLPLIARDRLIGVLSFGLARPYAFSSQDEDALTTCAEIFAVGLANSLAYETERTLRALFEGVGAAAVSISSTEELRSTLQTIAEQARQVVGAERAVLHLETGVGTGCPETVFSGVDAVDGAAWTPSWPLEALSGIPLDREMLRLDGNALIGTQAVPVGGTRLTSVLAVAVSFQGKRTGTLYLLNKRTGAFTVEDERAIALLATFVGATLHQAHLRSEVEAQRARLEAIVSNAPHPILYVDAGTRQLVANPRALEVLGDPHLARRAPGEIGGPLETPEGDRVEEEEHPFIRALRGECVRAEELVLFGESGKRIPCLISAAPVSVSGGGTTGAILTFEDITALKELERLRDEWASIISHDLGQPLHLLSISIELLSRLLARTSENIPPRVYDCIQSARASIFVLKRLAQDLAEASRMETHQVTVQVRSVDAVALVAAQLDRLRQLSDDHPIRFECDKKLPDIQTDPVRLEQILGNLVQNALKYSDGQSEIEVRLEPAGQELMLSVSNDGPGIPPEELPHIFERFFRTRAVRQGSVRGSGLGLYIVKGLVEALGGRVEAESVVGGRTTFRVYLPTGTRQLDEPQPLAAG